MMIHPETLYEMYIEGKDKSQIMTVIRGLKQNIGKLKNTIEDPPFGIISNMCPSYEIQIEYAREFLIRAKEGYAEAGGNYILSKSEVKTEDFELNIDEISQITFLISEFETYIVDINNGIKCTKKTGDKLDIIVLKDEDNEEDFTTETFLNALKELHIGEWRRNYKKIRNEFVVSDITQWELEFKYKNGHNPVRFSGVNSCPYNFDQFQLIFGISKS